MTGKAATKAAKLRRKRGRPALPATDREPNGQPSRRKAAMEPRRALKLAETEMEVRSTAVQRRVRHDNIVAFRDRSGRMVTAEEQALDPRRGYVLGLMLLDGTITKDQHDAGNRYAEEQSLYLRLAGLPFPSVRAQNLFAVRGASGEESDAQAHRAGRAREVAKAARNKLLAVGNIDTGRKVEHAVREVCLLDNIQARTWPAHMILLLKQGLNKL